ncbi:MAG: hypothetical protein LBB14_00880 [Puniceicoccales bacterium]|jgi:hypothetical protein|nr:hypothetical protein [Puniceicoccales bacterium]
MSYPVAQPHRADTNAITIGRNFSNFGFTIAEKLQNVPTEIVDLFCTTLCVKGATAAYIKNCALGECSVRGSEWFRLVIFTIFTLSIYFFVTMIQATQRSSLLEQSIRNLNGTGATVDDIFTIPLLNLPEYAPYYALISSLADGWKMNKIGNEPAGDVTLPLDVDDQGEFVSAVAGRFNAALADAGIKNEDYETPHTVTLGGDPIVIGSPGELLCYRTLLAAHQDEPLVIQNANGPSDQDVALERFNRRCNFYGNNPFGIAAPLSFERKSTPEQLNAFFECVRSFRRVAVALKNYANERKNGRSSEFAQRVLAANLNEFLSPNSPGQQPSPADGADDPADGRAAKGRRSDRPRAETRAAPSGRKFAFA